MSIKMRYLYASGKKKFVTIGDIVKEKFALTNNNAVDVIPPAYPCDKERFVFIGLTVKDLDVIYATLTLGNMRAHAFIVEYDRRRY